MFRSAFHRPSGDLVEADAEDDDSRAEGSGLRLAARRAREPLAQHGERGFDLLAAELLRVAVRDHAAPAPLAVGIVFVDLDADARVLAEHRDLAASWVTVKTAPSSYA